MKRLITPRDVIAHRFGKSGPPRWKVAVVSFSDLRHSRDLTGIFGAKPVKHKTIYGMEEYAPYPYVYEARVAGHKVGLVTRCNWGGPQAAIVVEELACMGVKWLVGMGLACSLSGDIARGTQIVAKAAIPSDGTSRAYTRGPMRADSRLLTIALKSSVAMGNPARPVTAATVDALYRETPALIRRLRLAGAEALNMECGPFYAAAKACGIRALWTGFVSDRAAGKKWEDWWGNHDEWFNANARICLETVKAILGKRRT